MRASSATSSSGVTANSAASSSIWRSKSSRCAFMETYSPAAIDEAPASRPARPASRTKSALALAPAKPMTRLRLETRPSLTPKTAARRGPPPAEGDAARELAQRAGVGALLRRQGGGARVLGGVVGRAADLGAVEQRVDRSRPAAAGGGAGVGGGAGRRGAGEGGGARPGPAEAGEKLQQPRLEAEAVRRQGHALAAQAALHHGGVACLRLRHLAQQRGAPVVRLAGRQEAIEVGAVQLVLEVREQELRSRFGVSSHTYMLGNRPAPVQSKTAGTPALPRPRLCSGRPADAWLA